LQILIVPHVIIQDHQKSIIIMDDGYSCRTNFKGLNFFFFFKICIKGTHMVDIMILTKMMRLVLMLLLLTICQSRPILKNVLSIHEMTILLVPLSSKAFLINIQDLIYSLNNKYFKIMCKSSNRIGKLSFDM